MKSFYLIVGLGAVAVFSIGMAAAQNISSSSHDNNLMFACASGSAKSYGECLSHRANT
jgi:hypothetical protein